MCPAHVLVAVSGGSDSVGLLISLHSILSEDQSFRGITLSAISIDHCIRDDAKNEVSYVADLCCKLGIHHVTVCWQGKKPKTRLMAAAREARYALIYDHAMSIGATIVVTAHTFDDQLETVYMRSQRDFSDKGIGLSGMSNIVLYNMSLWIARPFLLCRRDAIRSFLSQKNVRWCEDPSNVDDRFERVRARSLIQEIDMNDMFKKIVAFQNRRIALGNTLAELIPKYLRVYLQSVISISHSALMIDPAILSYLMRISIAISGGQNFLPGYHSVERLMSFLNNEKKGCISIGRVVLDRRLDCLWITRALRDLPVNNIAPGEAAVWDGRYRFTNSSKKSIKICSNSSIKEYVPFDIPTIVARRAFLSMPSSEGGEPLMAPFSRFLTGFDLPIARAFAVSFGKIFIPKLPFLYKKG
ncbi:MAG: tRNA lysidine(34) synthetase TilS [Candidatus Liberibacter europaeus]|uniref:tRNA(Ile)-lysidine synthase n=1 Tax=Candidatus Liberibacter europaeus TaxID=744859 RepID=A0A2T4VXH4_9HYPH|nr:tRNA lysidine(34) synthetase TilS [Candidatus Liberibacter europaeus]PTL86477.1 MAG: tRNA lysidine(34) synthetase TilS [Candidatus Liberibacter europaeus]